MAIYYAYNPNGSTPKYVEITEQEYLAAKQDEHRWFIRFGDYVLECSQQEFVQHNAEVNHSRYLQRNSKNQRIDVLSLDDLDTERLGPMDSGERTDETVLKHIRNEQLNAAIAKLNDDERDLIEAVFFRHISKADYAEIVGITHQALLKRYRGILQKLRDILQDVL